MATTAGSDAARLSFLDILQRCHFQSNPLKRIGPAMS
jgi:hypothetical protein